MRTFLQPWQIHVAAMAGSAPLRTFRVGRQMMAALARPSPGGHPLHTHRAPEESARAHRGSLGLLTTLRFPTADRESLHTNRAVQKPRGDASIRRERLRFRCWLLTKTPEFAHGRFGSPNVTQIKTGKRQIGDVFFRLYTDAGGAHAAFIVLLCRHPSCSTIWAAQLGGALHFVGFGGE